MNSNGSYFITGFCEQSIDNLRSANGKFIHEIFDDIQTSLHERGKSHPKYEWNDQTNYIRFKQKQKISLKDNEDEISSGHKAIELVSVKHSIHNDGYSPVNMNTSDDENDNKTI